jgi:hypothetical protein
LPNPARLSCFNCNAYCAVELADSCAADGGINDTKVDNTMILKTLRNLINVKTPQNHMSVFTGTSDIILNKDFATIIIMQLQLAFWHYI